MHIQLLAPLFPAVLVAASPAHKTTKTSNPPNCSSIQQNCPPKYSTYCSNYNSVTPSTTTTTISTGIATSTSTFIAGTVTATIHATTCALHHTSSNKLKRANTNKAPACLHATGSVQISSACSCLATTPTHTATATVATSTTTTTLTEMLTSTFTSLIAPPCATVTQGSYTFHDTVAACGVVENGSNPGGNQVFLSVYPGSVPSCDVITSCLSVAASKTSELGVLPTDNAGSIDLHYRASSDEWQCVGYQKISNDPGYFNIPDADVGAVYGFAI